MCSPLSFYVFAPILLKDVFAPILTLGKFVLGGLPEVERRISAIAQSVRPPGQH
jgi:hypothetical protein